MNQTINREIILNKSSNDQNVLIAGELIFVEAGAVAIVEIKLYAFDLKINSSSYFIIGEMHVTFRENPDGSYQAVIEIPEGTDANDKPVDMLALLNNVIPVNKKPVPVDDSVGYWDSGSIQETIMPVMLIHQVFGHKKKKEVADIAKEEIKDKLMEETEEPEEQEIINLDGRLRIGEEELGPKTVKSEIGTLEDYLSINSSRTSSIDSLEHSDYVLSESESELANSEFVDLEELEFDNLPNNYLDKIKAKEDELTEQTDIVSKEISDGATRAEISSQELDGTFSENITLNVIKLDGDTGNAVNTTSSDITTQLEINSGDAASKAGLKVDANNNVIETTTIEDANVLEKVIISAEKDPVLDIIVENPEVLAGL